MARKSPGFRPEIGKILAWLVLILIVFWLVSSWPKQKNDRLESTIQTTSNEETVTTNSQELPPETETSSGRAEITADVLNLRSEPSVAQNTVIGTLKRGAVIEVLEKNESWLKVRLDDGKSGYIAHQPQYIKFLE